MGFLILMILLALLVFWAAGSSGLLWRTRRLSQAHKALLAKYAINYQRRLPNEQRRMERIVATFMEDKEWVGAGMELKEEMKVMISACAAQLLVGHPDLVLGHFERFVVFPTSYRDHRSGRTFQGEVRPTTGTIIISWDDFLHGYAHGHDAHNVGLHELAHALWFENFNGHGEEGFLNEAFLTRWTELADAEIDRIRAGQDSFLRDYAGSNQAEFFAVAIEYFFERPLEFRDSLPELYALLCGLLKQDPAATIILN